MALRRRARYIPTEHLQVRIKTVTYPFRRRAVHGAQDESEFQDKKHLRNENNPITLHVTAEKFERKGVSEQVPKIVWGLRQTA